MSQTSSRERTIESLRAEMGASYDAARQRVMERLHGRHADELTRVQTLLRESSARARNLLGRRGDDSETPHKAAELSLHDLHTLDRLLSYIRHSVVRLCFYNLKLFCPSLVDEYDDAVRGNVLANIDQIGAVRAELESFFGQHLSAEKSLAELYPAIRKSVFRQLDNLIDISKEARDHLDEEAVRADFNDRVPPLIDGVMGDLVNIQADVDSHKVSVNEVVRKTTQLTQQRAHDADLELVLGLQPTSKVFADEAALTNAFTELITNAGKYSEGARLNVTVAPGDRGQTVVVAFEDDGAGMTPEELATCMNPGVSKGGTGDGLAMVCHIVEADHLGSFTIEAKPGKGCRCEVRLPVKLKLNQSDNKTT